MPYRWFRCTACGLLQYRGLGATSCLGLRPCPPFGSHARCWGRLVRCGTDSEPFSAAWLEARAMAAAFARE